MYEVHVYVPLRRHCQGFSLCPPEEDHMASYPKRSPGGDRETQHQDYLYRDWRQRGQMVMCIVVGNVGIRNMFKFWWGRSDHFCK